MTENGFRLVVLALAFGAPVTAHAGDCNKADCDEIKAEIREIESRMRSGYTRAQGERFEAKLRRLKRERRRACR